ncbi:MAG TPA: hypothetical protein PKX93_01000 [bacterium]|nr:hypothetical protein [bacterium]
MLKAGAVRLEITPPAGTHLAGSGLGEHRPARTVMDPLYVSALVLESGGRHLALISMDVTAVTEEWTDHVREAARQFGFSDGEVMVHATQTHSAPSFGHLMFDPDFPLSVPPEKEYLRGAETNYCRFALKKTIEALEKAISSLQPVVMGYGRAVQDRLAFNRRAVTRNGKVQMPFPAGRKIQPFGPTEICYLEGPVDPEVGVVVFQNRDMEVVAALLHFACHPVNVFCERTSYYAVSADWPGAWAAGMRTRLGKQCVPLVVNGCCGNINPIDPFDPEFVMDHRRMGAALTEVSCRLVPHLEFTDEVCLDSRMQRIALPYREIPEVRQAEVERILKQSDQPQFLSENLQRVDPQWFLAASTRSIEYCRRRNPLFPYEIQVFRLGPVALLGLAGEPFVEAQLALKVGSPASLTLVAHMISHYVGYLAPEECFARGGHEVHPACPYWAKLAPGSLKKVVSQAQDLLRSVF